MKRSAYLLSLAAAASTIFNTMAADWPQWRGPSFNGFTEEKALPTEFSKESAVWALDMPGPSASTPVVIGDKVFVSTADSQNKSLRAMCIDRKTGKVIWDHKTGDGINRDDRSNYSSPSPAADKDRVIFFYGNGTLVAFDHSGKELWQRSITKDYGDFAFQWTFSSSPMLAYGKLYLQVLQRDTPVHGKGKQGAESFLLAMDPATGKELFRHVRPSEAAAESLEAFSTPIPHKNGNRDEIVILGGDCITGHDPATGKEFWRWGSWNPNRIGHWRLVPSPVAGGGVILACAPKGSPVFAVKSGLNGNQDDSAIAWKSETREVSSDVSTPLFMDGDFFVLAEDKRSLSRVEPATGKVKWTSELPGRKKFEASPTGADGKIYLMNFAGDVAVVDAKEGKVLNTVPMGDGNDDMVRSTIVAANGQLLIRTNKKLYCIGKGGGVALAK
ncbi:MAG TPA: PQQ-binding-like beta-propeller repeat protein [Candidatus Kapabacteria bacterium]|nr:PQQ-binding-like beta-propeller repeat protein [Candidatus Kapabacteria bacterium]